MNTLAIAEPTSRLGSSVSVGAVDRHVSLRIRQRRVTLGLTQQQLGELVGVTYQQAHKYETAVNRISAGRLHQFAEALGVEVNFFYKGVGPDDAAQTSQRAPTPQQRMLLDLSRQFARIKNHQHQNAVCYMARALCSRH